MSDVSRSCPECERLAKEVARLLEERGVLVAYINERTDWSKSGVIAEIVARSDPDLEKIALTDAAIRAVEAAHKERP